MENDVCHVIPVGREPLPIHVPERSEVTSSVGKVNENKHSNRFAILNEFIDSGMLGLPPLQSLVWLVLYRDARGNVAEVSASYIARRIGVVRRSVTRALKGLRDRDLICILKRGGLNKGANTYLIHPKALRRHH